jgi:hypothetical protein
MTRATVAIGMSGLPYMILIVERRGRYESNYIPEPSNSTRYTVSEPQQRRRK